MNIYTQILRTFEHNSVSDGKSLETLLQQIPESDNYDAEIAALTGKGSPPSALVTDLCRSLADIAQHLGSLYDGGGIQQFSLNAESRIREDNVRKALFLSRTPTIFTQHRFHYGSVEFWNSADAENVYRESWEISHDFIRDLFRYQEAIERGQLIILPSSITQSRYTGDISRSHSVEEKISLLEEMERTRVFNMNVAPQLVDAIIERYKTEHQLISLPDLSVPWIENLDVKSILKVRDDHSDLLDDFQRAYHRAVLAYIENHRSLDFAQISRQINEDVIDPQLAKIEKNYKRIVLSHRSLALTGAAVSLIPIGGVILSGVLLNQLMSTDIIKLAPTVLAGLLTTVATNRINQGRAIQALEDNAYYILWKIRKEH